MNEAFGWSEAHVQEQIRENNKEGMSNYMFRLSLGGVEGGKMTVTPPPSLPDKQMVLMHFEDIQAQFPLGNKE